MKNQTPAALLIAVLLVAPASGSEPVSPAFDGTYSGKTDVMRMWTNPPGCTTGTDITLLISGGYFDPAADGTHSDFITSDGYFKGDFKLADGNNALFEGNLETGDRLFGSAFDESTNCAWEVELFRAD